MYKDFFPDLSDYNTSDFRQLTLYSWSFDIYATKAMIEHINKSLCDSINELGELAIIGNDNHDFKAYNENMLKVGSLNRVEPYAFSSCVLSIYSIVEACLDRYCNICCDQFKLKLELEDMKDKGITRAITYLEKVVQIENVKSHNLWKLIQLINQIRNDIIHRAGIPTTKKISVYSSELSVECEDGRLYITYENAMQIHNICDNFLKFVLSRNFLIQLPKE